MENRHVLYYSINNLEKCTTLIKRSKNPTGNEASLKTAFLKVVSCVLLASITESLQVRPNDLDSEMKHLLYLQTEDNCESHSSLFSDARLQLHSSVPLQQFPCSLS